ncbi:MAG TPA: nitroreductase [Bacteroidota bacterium]|nr:nitroreductase [Bacteroidota bacterium]
MSTDFDPMITPYAVDENDFPWSGTPEEQALFLLQYAVLAPSTHNTQPWKFAVVPGGIEVFADYARRMPVVDPGNRELLMSVGAAVFTLRVAAERFGMDCRVTYSYSNDSERPLAVVALAPRAGGGAPDEALASLFGPIVRRHTNRHPFLLSRVPEAIIRRIRGLHAGGMAGVVVSTDGNINSQVSEIVAAADRMQMADPSFRSDIAEWIRPNWTQRHDGVTGAALGMNTVSSALGAWTTRVVDTGAVRAARDRNLCAEAPGLLVIQSEDATAHWLACGELLQHTLLVLTREGLHHSYFNMPVQVPELRVRLRAVCGLSAWPQLLLRVGFSLTEPSRTPRRPVDEVLMVAPGAAHTSR